MSHRLGCLGLTLILVACKEPQEAPEETKDAAPAAGAPAPAEDPPAGSGSTAVLTLGEAKIMREGHADRAIELHADGSVTLAGMPFGTLSTDGRLLDPEGALMMTAREDGSVIGRDGGPIGITLDATGGRIELDKLKVKVSFSADGTIEIEASGEHAVLLQQGAPKLRSEGCTGPVQRSCALLTSSYLMALGNPDSVQEADLPDARGG
jgi:hypothetical protein